MYEKDDVLKGKKKKIVLNRIRINVYFGYGLKFIVIKILSIYDYSNLFLAFGHSPSSFLSCFSMCREKKACVSYSTMEMVMLSLYS